MTCSLYILLTLAYGSHAHWFSLYQVTQLVRSLPAWQKLVKSGELILVESPRGRTPLSPIHQGRGARGHRPRRRTQNSWTRHRCRSGGPFYYRVMVPGPPPSRQVSHLRALLSHLLLSFSRDMLGEPDYVRVYLLPFEGEFVQCGGTLLHPIIDCCDSDNRPVHLFQWKSAGPLGDVSRRCLLCGPLLPWDIFMGYLWRSDSKDHLL